MTTTGEPLWDKHDVADYAGISVSGVKNWIKRRAVPVAGHTDPERGRVSNLYRPADVRAAKDSAPGKGNRTPRKAAQVAVEPPQPPAGTEPLPEHFREVLDYLVAETDRDPSAYCWAAGKQDLYHMEYGGTEWKRSEGTFLYTTLKAMENRGLVQRQTRYESMIRGPRTRYTIARLTDSGREALRTGRTPKLKRKDTA